MKEFRLFGVNRAIEEFVNPLFVNLIKPFWPGVAKTFLPMALDLFSCNKDHETAMLLDKEKMLQGQAKTQSLVDEQLQLSRDMQDPTSVMNQKVLNMLTQQADESGASTASAVSKLAAQTGVGGGQALMQSADAQNNARSQVERNFQNMMNQRFNQSTGLFSNAMNMQKGLDENMMNIDMYNMDASNVGAATGGTGPDLEALLGKFMPTDDKGKFNFGKWDSGAGFFKNIGNFFGGGK